jgi:tRNA pseudouridine38-40 synthase
VKAIVEYDGTRYVGFQRQSQRPSIQGALENAIAVATGTPNRVTAAGRTDAGAHAWAQVVSFTTNTRLDDVTLTRALNAHLSSDIAVRSIETVDSSFDPRRQAVKREYHYLVVRRGKAPLWHGRAHRIDHPLNIEDMRIASRHLVGIHDFAAFGSPSMSGGATIREIFDIRIIEDGEMIRFEFDGSSFLRHMIRSMVGTLLDVGSCRLKPSAVQTILASRDRRQAAAPVPACGLYLMNVTYGHEASTKGNYA